MEQSFGPIGIAAWAWDLTRNEVWLSDAGYRMLGYEPGEVEAGFDSWKSKVHPDDSELALAAFHKHYEGGVGPLSVRIRMRGKNGNDVPVLMHGGIVERAPDGKPSRLEGVQIDLSGTRGGGDDRAYLAWVLEHRKAQSDARESEVRFRNVIHGLPMGIHLYRLEADGRLIFEGANPSADRLLGVDNRKFIGMAVEDAFPGLRGTEVGERYRLAAADGTTWRTEQITYQDDQLRGTFEVVAFQTSPGRMAAAFNEITERLRAYAAVQRSEEKHRNLFESMAQGVLHLDADGRIIAANPAATRILGLQPDRLRGRVVFDDRWHPVRSDLSEFGLEQQPPALARRTNTAQQAVVGVVNPTVGERRWIDVTAVLASVLDHADAPATYVTLTDITERVQAEKDKARLEAQFLHSQKMQAVGRLAGGIAHDFNNLLTAIQGYTDLIRRRIGSQDPSSDDVEQIARVGQRAAALTQQLLAFSRKQPIEPRPVDINRQVLNAERMLHRLIGENIELTLQLDPLVGMVMADPNQIDQVLLNLSVNARDAMPGGGKLVFATANVTLGSDDCLGFSEVPPGEFVMLSVSDTGCGMDEATQRQAFEPFFTTKTAGEGTGLGLSTVYGIVRQHKGVVQLESKRGHGTTVKVNLPRAADSERASAPLAVPDAVGGQETIVVVEDESIVRELAVRILTLLGYRVLEARDGESAEQICREHKGPIGCLLTDVVMPGIDGRELGERLLAIHPEMRVLFMSGYTESVMAHHGVVGQGISFLQKPFSVAGLAKKVREVLDAGRG